MLSEHEHVIDCIVWAPTESCRTIDNSNYMSGVEEREGEEMNGEVEEEKREAAAS